MMEEHLRYLGTLKLLEECSPHVPDELRDRIEEALLHASIASDGAIKVRRILKRITVEVT